MVNRPTLHGLWKYVLSVPLLTVSRSYVKLSTDAILSNQLSWSLEQCYPSHCSSSEKMFCHYKLVTFKRITDAMVSVPMHWSFFSSNLHSFFFPFFSFSSLLPFFSFSSFLSSPSPLYFLSSPYPLYFLLLILFTSFFLLTFLQKSVWKNKY